MSLSNSRLAFLDCYKVLDDAFESPNGIRIRVPHLNSAIHFRLRLNQARVLTRKENTRIYKEGDPQYGTSAYDSLVIRIRESEDGVWVHLEKHATSILAIEPLPDTQGITFEPPKLLEAPRPEPEPEVPALTRRRI